MLKTIGVRGKKNLVAVFAAYARNSGEQDTSRPKAAKEFIDFIGGLPLNEETARTLRNAARYPIEDSEIPDSSVPTFMKITVEVAEATWEQAMRVFRYAFSLKNDPQMPYFLRVAGIAYLLHHTERDPVCPQKRNISVEKFRKLDIDQKLDEIYKFLLESGGSF